MTIKDGYDANDYGLAYLRDRGYAVVVFSPDELQGADPGCLQERLIEYGNEAIGNLIHLAKRETSMHLYEVICRPVPDTGDARDQLCLRVLAPGAAHMTEAVEGTKATWYFLEHYHYAITDVDFTLPTEMDALRDRIKHHEVNP